MKDPKVSIIIPVYNVEDYLKKCLDSVVQQTMHELEIIVINDESTDNSLDIIRNYEKNDPRFVVVDQKNKGLGGARNSGIELARGEYIFFLDSDDFIKSNTVEVLYQYATTNDLDLVVFNYTKVDENDRPVAKTAFGEGVVPHDEAFEKILSLKTSPQAWNKLYKRELFVRYEIRYPEKFLHEDLPVTYKLFWHAKNIGYLPDNLYFWLIRSNSITQKFTFQHINDVTESLRQIKYFLIENNLYGKYQNAFVRGSMQMLNIMMERAILFSRQNPALKVYIKYIVDSGKIVDRQDIEQLQQHDEALYEKFNKHYYMIYRTQNEKPVDSCTMRLINFLLPLHSKRRKIVKKILRR